MEISYYVEKLRARLEYSHGVILVLATAICFFTLPLAGCSSSRSGMPNIYLTALSYQRSANGSKSVIPPSLNSTFSNLVGDASMTIRAGYFGVCIRSSMQDWICHKDAKSFATVVNITQDPLNLISHSIIFRESIVFSGLIIISIALGLACILPLATFPNWERDIDNTGLENELKPFPNRKLVWTICAILAATILLALLSSLWQHVAAVAFTTTVQNMAYGSVKSEVGSAAIGFGWASLALYIVALCAMLVLTLSLRTLERLTDE